MKPLADNYIVRIYRGEGKDHLAGVVEEAGAEGRSPFTSVDELVRLLMKNMGAHAAKGEKRAARRLKLRLPVRITGIDAAGKRFREEASIGDLSSGGAFLLMRSEVKVNARLSMTIAPGLSDYGVRVRVLRTSKAPLGAGVAFYCIRFS